MTGGRPRRRLRIRRKRRGESLAEVVEAAGNEVVLEAGCCFVEAIGSAVVMAAILTVPAYLLLHKVT